MITLGGISLLIPSPEVEAFINRTLPLEEANLYGSLPCRTESRSDSNRHSIGLPVYNWPAPPPPKLNSLYWPSGASRWARGWFLCTGKAKDEIVAQAHSSGGTTALELKLGDEDANVQYIDLYLLPPRPLSGIVPGSTQTPAEIKESLWLLPLVDVRYFWQFIPSGNLEFDSSSTWEDAFTDLGTALGVTIDADDVDADYLQPDWVELTRRYSPVPVLLDAVAASVGQRIIRDPEEGTVTSQSVANAKTALQSNYDLPLLSLAAGGDLSASLGDIPAKVRVNFRRWSQYNVYCDGEVYTTTSAASATADPPTSTVSGKERIFHSTLYAEYPYNTAANSAGDPTNKTTLDALAAQIAADYYGWLSRLYDVCWNGVVDWTPTGFDDAIIWEPTRTRVWSLPSGVGVDRQLSQDADYEVFDQIMLGKPDADIAAGATGTVSVWDRPASGTLADTTFNVQATALAGAVTSGLYVSLFWNCGRWLVSCYES